MKNKKIYLMLLISFFYSQVWAKVDPPNYSFKLEHLDPLLPGKSLKAGESQYGESVFVMEEGDLKIFRLYVHHFSFRISVLVQVRGDVIQDLYVSLPSSFLHDLFHQELITKLGKQDQYVKKEEQAMYLWKNKESQRHVYEAACTITCFPIFYSVYLEGAKSPILVKLFKGAARP